MRFVKGIVMYYPDDIVEFFENEFKWMYRSWIEMQKYEPTKWRTDLVVFIDDELKETKNIKFFNELNCSFSNRRKSQLDPTMCTLINYKPIRKRKLSNLTNPIFQDEYPDSQAKYEYLLNKVDIFNSSISNLLPLYQLLKRNLNDYIYTDSILMAFDGYEYFKSAGYDYLIRSDIDVFFTPLFSTWLPKSCNDFYVGKGGFSDSFNKNRLKRVAYSLGLKNADIDNLGSTWYSTPDQFRIVSYLTLIGMAYLSREEFTPPEKEYKYGAAFWPYWHYGVLLLYGQSLALNHLIALNQLNVIKLEYLLDHHSMDEDFIYNVLNIHATHNQQLFSKFEFKRGNYDNMTVREEDSHIIKYYCLKMALDGKRTSGSDLYEQFLNAIKNKN